MAQLTPEEFRALTAELVSRHGIRKVQERLMGTNVVVSRRGIANESMISRTLYGLTAGLARESAATHVVIALWEDALGSSLDEEASRSLEELASRINSCLTETFEEISGREDDLDSAIREYRENLAVAVGDLAACLTMLMRAVPAVARRIRADPGLRGRDGAGDPMV